MTEHHLFISHQAGMDIMWDKVRPAILAVEVATKDLPAFVGVCMKAGTVASGAKAAALVVQHAREQGLI